MKRLTLLSLFVASALLLSSCSLHLGLSQILGGGGSGTSATKTVKATHTPPANPNGVSIANAKYRPKNLTIKVGTSLTWTNNDAVPQSVTSDAPGLFDSGLLQPGATFSYTFTKAGVFPYHSSATKTTFGTVTVTP
jgi:plastocyanin